jgi:beta-lactamase regulating signal transducer with metallopeptidase domain
MSRKEILLLSAALGFLIIWVLDLRAGTPPEVNTFWTKIFYHYSWLMMCVGCLFYFQYSKQIRLKKEEQSSKSDKKEPAVDLKSCNVRLYQKVRKSKMKLSGVVFKH